MPEKAPRPKPQFLRDIEHDGSILRELTRIKKEERREMPEPSSIEKLSQAAQIVDDGIYQVG